MKTWLFYIVLSTSFSFAVFAQEGEYAFEDLSYETDGVLHEMFLACVATKTECATLAHHQGYPVSKVVTDRARCPKRPKTKACIIKH